DISMGPLYKKGKGLNRFNFLRYFPKTLNAGKIMDMAVNNSSFKKSLTGAAMNLTIESMIKIKLR
ncbi:MAG TPA: hypothetical protein VK369_03765, partial [Segetibacter sp.]|nr:hypothetical protein [Segetibacter sp.]